jgi:hypothetical protein
MQRILENLPGLEAKTTGVEHERTHGCSIAGFIKEEGSNAVSLCRA